MKRALGFLIGFSIIWGVPARGDPANLRALPSSDILWRPSSGEFTRFEALLPRAAIGEALRHDDSSTLYYLASVRDLGIKLRPRAEQTYHLSWDPTGLEVSARHNIAPNYFVTLGASGVGHSPMPLAELEYVTSPDPLAISIVTASFADGPSLGWVGTRLSLDETRETYWSLSYEGSGEALAASYGATWFSCLAEFDCTAAAGWADGLSAGIELTRDIQDFAGSASVTLRQNRPPTITIGVTREFGNYRTNIRSSSRGADIFGNVSLKALRRRDLPAAWRRDISLAGIRDALSENQSRQ